MGKGVQTISAKEALEILSQPYLNTNEIGKIASVGRDNARKIRREIEKQLLEEGYNLTSKVPTDRVVKYLNLNINYLKKMCN